MIGYRAHIYSALNPGDAVIVACEKGENLGIVTQALSMNDYLMMKYNTTAINPADISKYFGRIIRVASRPELIALQQKDADEREIVQVSFLLCSSIGLIFVASIVKTWRTVLRIASIFVLLMLSFSLTE